MPFTLFPAVDVSAGRAVRSPESDPLVLALARQAAGAAWIHLVDLDAAFGRGSNAELLAEIIGALDVDVQLAGGIDDDASLTRALATGCARVNLATTALANRSWCERAIATHGARVAVSIDVRAEQGTDGTTDYRLAARGAVGDREAGADLWETLAWLERAGCMRVVVTDVSADGSLRGTNQELYRNVTHVTEMLVIASGGIASIDDLVALAHIAEHASHANLEGAIVGTALNAGRFTLAAAIGAVVSAQDR